MSEKAHVSIVVFITHTWILELDAKQATLGIHRLKAFISKMKLGGLVVSTLASW